MRFKLISMEDLKLDFGGNTLVPTSNFVIPDSDQRLEDEIYRYKLGTVELNKEELIQYH